MCSVGFGGAGCAASVSEYNASLAEVNRGSAAQAWGLGEISRDLAQGEISPRGLEGLEALGPGPRAPGAWASGPQSVPNWRSAVSLNFSAAGRKFLFFISFIMASIGATLLLPSMAALAIMAAKSLGIFMSIL